jgi:hypothetical protein
MSKVIVLDSGHGKKRFWHCQNARELISHQWHLFGRSADEVSLDHHIHAILAYPFWGVR